MSTQTASLGHNRTGIASSPSASRSMVEGAGEFLPVDLTLDERGIGLLRESYANGADPLGSVPPPLDAEGMAGALIQGIKGNRPTQLIDKLGERIAFERVGVRLYEALISKLNAFGGIDGGPTIDQLEETMLQEHEHFKIASDAVVDLGGDPTVMTPSADLHATMSKGILEALVEPRTTFAQCLEGILLAELADNECWESLIELARQNGKGEMAGSFERALAEEREHLANVRTWLAAAQNREPVS
jgi:hypothetical protein